MQYGKEHHNSVWLGETVSSTSESLEQPVYFDAHEKHVPEEGWEKNLFWQPMTGIGEQGI